MAFVSFINDLPFIIVCILAASTVCIFNVYSILSPSNSTSSQVILSSSLAANPLKSDLNLLQGCHRSWKVLDFEKCPGKSWNFRNFKENPGIVLEFFTRIMP